MDTNKLIIEQLQNIAQQIFDANKEKFQKVLKASKVRAKDIVLAFKPKKRTSEYVNIETVKIPDGLNDLTELEANDFTCKFKTVNVFKLLAHFEKIEGVVGIFEFDVLEFDVKEFANYLDVKDKIRGFNYIHVNNDLGYIGATDAKVAKIRMIQPSDKANYMVDINGFIDKRERHIDFLSIIPKNGVILNLSKDLLKTVAKYSKKGLTTLKITPERIFTSFIDEGFGIEKSNEFVIDNFCVNATIELTSSVATLMLKEKFFSVFLVPIENKLAVVKNDTCYLFMTKVNEFKITGAIEQITVCAAEPVICVPTIDNVDVVDNTTDNVLSVPECHKEPKIEVPSVEVITTIEKQDYLPVIHTSEQIQIVNNFLPVIHESKSNGLIRIVKSYQRTKKQKRLNANIVKQLKYVAILVFGMVLGLSMKYDNVSLVANNQNINNMNGTFFIKVYDTVTVEQLVKVYDTVTVEQLVKVYDTVTIESNVTDTLQTFKEIERPEPLTDTLQNESVNLKDLNNSNVILTVPNTERNTDVLDILVACVEVTDNECKCIIYDVYCTMSICGDGFVIEFSTDGISIIKITGAIEHIKKD